ncbi:hypothetical protein, partial [Paracandidimonas soli]|uniref:hypothetical protein n=1 Tax=Paracandidimonas soli TaxID=1917182 RepID=UPI00333E52C5
MAEQQHRAFAVALIVDGSIVGAGKRHCRIPVDTLDSDACGERSVCIACDGYVAWKFSWPSVQGSVQV